MFGRTGNSGLAIGVAVVVIGGLLAWLWLGDTDPGDRPVDEAAGVEQGG